MSLWEMSFSGAVMIMAVTVIRALLINRLPKKTFLILWGMVMLRLVIPYTIPSVFSVYSLIPEKWQAGDFLSGSNDTLAVNTVTEGRMAEEAAVHTTAAISAEWLIWLIGLCICAGYFLIAYVKLYREFQMSFPVKNQQMEQWIGQHKKRYRIDIRQSDRITAPVSYGIIHPVILFPKKTDWNDVRALQYVLEHEYVHIIRHDSILKLLVTAILCIHWFNPLIWVMYVLFHRDLELACDECVIQRFGIDSKSAYALTLVGMEEQKSGFTPLCNNFSKNAIEERITAIMKTKKTTIGALVLAAAVILGVAGGFATSAGGNESDEKIENTISEDVMLSYSNENGEVYYSADGGATFFDEEEFQKRYPPLDVEWWTYEEYKEWLENEKVQLQGMLGDRGYTGGLGDFVWTQELIDETIAQYEKTLQDIKAGLRISKSVNGKNDIVLAGYNEEAVMEVVSESRDDLDFYE